MPQLSSNIPSTVFYGSILSEFLRIARSTLLFEDYYPKANALYLRMIAQGGEERLIVKQIKKAFNRHGDAFQKYHQTPSEIINKVTLGI